MSSYKYGYFVNSCPLSKEETTKAASRLKCGIDENGRSQFVCVPNQNLTALVEFCYTKSIIGLYQIGYCLITIGNGFLDQISCKKFTEGCPTEYFRSTDLYKYPFCHRLNKEERCFVAEPSCGNSKKVIVEGIPTVVRGILNATTDYTFYPTSIKSDLYSESEIVGSVIGVILSLTIIFGIIFILCLFWRRGRRKRHHRALDMMVTNEMSPEENLAKLFDDLILVLESEEYKSSLGRILHECYPEYLQLIEKRKKDLLKEDHGIVIAGPRGVKSMFINRMLQKEIFRGNYLEHTVYKIRNSEKVIIVTESANGEILELSLKNCNIETESGLSSLRDTLKNLTDTDNRNIRSVEIGFQIPILKRNTIIVDIPEEDDLGQETKKLMEYLPNAVSFIFVVDKQGLDGKQKNKVSSEEKEASKMEFAKFQQSLKNIVEKNEMMRLSNHLRFLQDVLKIMLLGIDSGLSLGKRSEEEQKALAKKHKEKIMELNAECVEKSVKLRDDFEKIIQEVAKEAYDYMSTDLGKDKILTPPGSMSLTEIPYDHSTFRIHIKMRIEMYVKDVLQSERIQDEFHRVKESVLEFYTKVSSQISEMENDWTKDLEGNFHNNVEEGSLIPHTFHIPMLLTYQLPG